MTANDCPEDRFCRCTVKRTIDWSVYGGVHGANDVGRYCGGPDYLGILGRGRFGGGPGQGGY